MVAPRGLASTPGRVSSGAMESELGPRLAACPCCGLVHELEPVAARRALACVRCGTTLWNPERRARSRSRVSAAALAGLVFYPLAISLPVLSFERFGHRSEASVWGGSLGLLREGELLVGLVVFLCSVVLPLGKLLGLLALSSGLLLRGARNRAATYRWVEWTGRWGMLDVLLIAVTVAWVKLGDLVEVQAGPGALLFLGCVAMSLLAAAWFDPHALWEAEPVPAPLAQPRGAGGLA